MILECNILKIVKSYDTETNIQLKLPREEKTERSEWSEGFKEQEEVHGQNSNVELTNESNNSDKIFEEILDNNSNYITTKSEKLLGTAAMESSDPSEPSGSYYVSNLPRSNMEF